MSILHQTIEQALKDKAPQLHADLKAAGKLAAHVNSLALEVKDQAATALMEQRAKLKLDSLPMEEKVAGLAVARQGAMESALAGVLEFPPDETSSPSQG